MCKFKVREVILKNGEKVTGTVVPVFPAKVLVQTDEICLELSETEIQSLDGKKDFRNLIEPYDSSVREETMIHQYNEDGSMVSLNKLKETNNSEHILGKLRFLRASEGGITKEFEELFNQQEYFDSFGYQLPVTIEERLENGWKYNVEFPVPVAPGDVYEITLKDRWPKWAKYEDNHWHARHHIIQTAKATIYTQMFILPKGAKVSSVTPQPLRQFDFNGKPTIIWKRYMPPNEAATFEAIYK